ncbi:hypothetical protein NPIL_13791 [Nephila pilipes]|uniref:Uncharacterized protein n=1 Tax=Nephila pilipes TaxID=299642 RepID=A0A8X6SYG5_NEPPI|nr:hypothetical protein NPIL_13791 [Nephila pilipes]
MVGNGGQLLVTVNHQEDNGAKDELDVLQGKVVMACSDQSDHWAVKRDSVLDVRLIPQGGLSETVAEGFEC